MSGAESLGSKELAALIPEDFLFGVGTAAYQIEGATRLDGRSDSVWDVFCREPGRIRNGDSGDLACDHYKRWKEDVRLLCDLGVDAYRFSISWSRILPDDSGVVNNKGIAFYQNLISALRAAGIRPLVTLHHWDLPQYIQDEGGWLQRSTATKFAEFAEIVATEFGQSVDFYTTINEPWCVAFLGHRSGIHAPGIQDDRAASCVAHHLLLAHGLCVRNLRRCSPHAEVGIVLNGGLSHAASSSQADMAAARLAESEQIHLFADPLFKREYPSILEDRMAVYVEPGDMEIIGETCDYLGWNYYTRNVVSAVPDGGYEFVTSGEYPLTDIGWEIYSDGLREVVCALNDRYDLPPLYVTENGAAFDDIVSNGSIHDGERVAYLQDHLRVIADLVEEGQDIRGYVCWSLMDNFEWAEGYSKRFGLVHVDFETQKRTMKDSGKFLAHLMQRRLELVVQKQQKQGDGI